MTTSRRRPQSRSRRGGTRQRTTWENLRFNFVQTGGAQTNLLDLSHSSIISGASSGGTAKRLIGSLGLENAGSTSEHIEFGIGILVVTEDALTGGATPTPLDLNDEDQDWYFWATRSLHVAVAAGLNSQFEIGIDIKTSRLLRGGYRLIAAVEKDVTVETSWNVSLSMRVLWALRA